LFGQGGAVRHSRASRALLERSAALAALLALACAQAPLRAQEVYKSVDAEGHVVYSDRAPTKNAPKTSLRVDEPDPAEAARLAKEQQRLQADDTQRSKQQAVDDKARAAADRKKEEACQSARSKYYRLRDARRISVPDDDGNRVFYSDEQADALRQEAKRAMDSACAGVSEPAH
jgi:Domain of unknown function (DUF4124)